MRHQQLSLFTRPATAAMRDRTKTRNYSPEKEEFRRDHARRRRWGLARRHAQKLCRTHGCSRECAEVGLHDHSEAVPPLIWPDEAGCAQRPPTTAPSRDAPTGRAATIAPAWRQSQHAPGPPATPDPATPTEPTMRAKPAGQDKPAGQPEPTSHAKSKSPADETARLSRWADPRQPAAADQRASTSHRSTPSATQGPGYRRPLARSAVSISGRIPADHTAANPPATNPRRQPPRGLLRPPTESRTPHQSMRRCATKDRRRSPPNQSTPPSKCRAPPARRAQAKGKGRVLTQHHARA